MEVLKPTESTKEESLLGVCKVIIINGYDEEDKLIMSDNGYTVASPGDKILWVVDPNCRVAEITEIDHKPGSDDVFAAAIRPLWNSQNAWTGVIKPIHGSMTETYYIKYKKVGDPQDYNSDPIIQVNS